MTASSPQFANEGKYRLQLILERHLRTLGGGFLGLLLEMS
jgi:hypothetical protein